MPKRGKKGKKRTEYENQPWFQNLQRFRAGGEAKITSYFKNMICQCKMEV
jgi:IS5 family transposase